MGEEVPELAVLVAEPMAVVLPVVVLELELELSLAVPMTPPKTFSGADESWTLAAALLNASMFSWPLELESGKPSHISFFFYPCRFGISEESRDHHGAGKYYLRRVDHSHHARLAMLCHTTVVPDGVSVVHRHGEDFVLYSIYVSEFVSPPTLSKFSASWVPLGPTYRLVRGRNHPGEEPTLADWRARVLKGRLSNKVSPGVEVEFNLVTHRNLQRSRSEGEPVFTHVHVVNG